MRDLGEGTSWVGVSVGGESREFFFDFGFDWEKEELSKRKEEKGYWEWRGNNNEPRRALYTKSVGRSCGNIRWKRIGKGRSCNVELRDKEIKNKFYLIKSFFWFLVRKKLQN